MTLCFKQFLLRFSCATFISITRFDNHHLDHCQRPLACEPDLNFAKSSPNISERLLQQFFHVIFHVQRVPPFITSSLLYCEYIYALTLLQADPAGAPSNRDFPGSNNENTKPAPEFLRIDTTLKNTLTAEGGSHQTWGLSSSCSTSRAGS